MRHCCYRSCTATSVKSVSDAIPTKLSTEISLVTVKLPGKSALLIVLTHAPQDVVKWNSSGPLFLLQQKKTFDRSADLFDFVL